MVGIIVSALALPGLPRGAAPALPAFPPDAAPPEAVPAPAVWAHCPPAPGIPPGIPDDAPPGIPLGAPPVNAAPAATPGIPSYYCKCLFLLGFAIMKYMRRPYDKPVWIEMVQEGKRSRRRLP